MSCEICFDHLSEFVCSCKNLLLCNACIQGHENSQGIHKIENLLKFKLSTDIINKIKDINTAKSKIVSETKSLIKLIKNCANSALNDLENLEKKYQIQLNKTNTEKAQNKNISELESKVLDIFNISIEVKNLIKKSYSEVFYFRVIPKNEWSLSKKVNYFNQFMNDNLTWISELKFSDNEKYVFRCKFYLGKS